MKTQIAKCSLLLALGLQIFAAQARPPIIPKVVYGSDNRVEAYKHPDRRLRELSKSVAGMVSKRHLSEQTSVSELERLRYILDPELFEQYYDFFNDMAGSAKNDAYMITRNETLERSQRVCSDERFASQNVLPVCTGFLIAPNVLLTAGHCVTNTTQCRDYVWVFDYLDSTKQVLKKNVYSCKRVIDQQFGSSFFNPKDYALIELDRASEREPMELRRRGNINRGDSVAVIGHPSGLPLKIADNATVQKNYLFTFKTNLDTFAGNSGSPVVNVHSGLVEGILVEGAEDYTIDSVNSCRRVAKRANDRSDSQERVFKVTRIKELEDIL